MSQVLGEGPTADGGRIDDLAQAALHFGGGAAIGCGRLGGEELAQEWRGARRPVRGVVAARGAGRPAILLVAGASPQIVGVEFVEASATQTELRCGRDGGDRATAEAGEHFADQRSTETVGELTIMFFIAARMAARGWFGEGHAPALRA